MLFAHTAPLLKSLAVGGLLLGLGIGAAIAPEGPAMKRLALHAEAHPNHIYLSAWEDGDVRIRMGELRPIRFEIRATLDDTCRWLATETLVPLDERTFSYAYDETMLGCDEGATPRYIPTPRQGFVTVVAD
jgi:hypothetical protein